MERRLLLVLGILGALCGLLLILLLSRSEPPRSRLSVEPRPPASIPQEEQGERAERQSGTLKGRVVSGKTGEGIPGAKVVALSPHLEPAKSKEEVPTWGGLIPRKTVHTDEKGYFSIEALPPDYWNLWVEKKGFAWTTVPRAKFTEEHEIQLWPGCSVKGQVVYPDGFPAPGVRIEYHVQGTHSEVFSRYKLESYYATTRADGTFQYEDLPPGKFTIEVYPPDHLPAPWRFEPPLEPGENRDVGVHKLDDGFSMTVRVVWRETNEPVPDVEVAVRPIGDPMPRTNIGQRRLTDANGIARFKGLGGQLAEHPQLLVAANLPDGPVLADEGGMHPPGSTVTIRLRKAGSVKGMVERPNGDPLDQFAVDLEPVGHIERQLRDFGENGKFQVFQIPGGSYKLHIRHGNFVDKEIDVEVVGGQELDVGTIRLEEGAQISGTVRRSNGGKLEGVVRVNLGAPAKTAAGKDAWVAAGHCYVQQDGSYVLKGVAPGGYALWPESIENPTATTDPVEITVPAGVAAVQKDLVLYAEGLLDLRFVDEIDGSMRQVVQPPTYLVETATGKEIRWLGSGTRLRPGSYEVYVELPDAQGVPRRYKARDVEVAERPPRGQGEEGKDPIEIRLFEVRDGS
ncbi:MAG TPA: carboxypeptidase regulatory-like domain-containing protein [Planctomycetota bacterium]|nr:carboxypeptidase regulatory-like domain-containing protein [Planctomycetota bacterium]